MRPDEVIALVGEVLYGPRWQTDLARDLLVNDRTMRRWASADEIPQFRVAVALAHLLEKRRIDLLKVEITLAEAMNVWGQMMPNAPRLPAVHLTQAQVDELKAPWNGKGGFQSLGPKLAAKVEPDLTLKLTDVEFGTIVRHMNYEQSGFRDRVRRIFGPEIARLANV